MTRLDDWLVRLGAYLDAVRRQPHAWGTHDCALFAAGGVLAMTGVDLAAGWVGAYSTEEEGLALLRAQGFEDHCALVERHFTPCPPLSARVGDIAGCLDGNHISLGIVGGAVIHVLKPRGLGVVPLDRAALAWRV